MREMLRSPWSAPPRGRRRRTATPRRVWTAAQSLCGWYSPPGRNIDVEVSGVVQRRIPRYTEEPRPGSSILRKAVMCPSILASGMRGAEHAGLVRGAGKDLCGRRCALGIASGACLAVVRHIDVCHRPFLCPGICRCWLSVAGGERLHREHARIVMPAQARPAQPRRTA